MILVFLPVTFCFRLAERAFFLALVVCMNVFGTSTLAGIF